MKVPPPPCVIHRAGNCPSQRRWGSGRTPGWRYRDSRGRPGPFVPCPPRKRTSSISELRRPSTGPHGAGLMPPVKEPMPVTILSPPRGASSSGLGAPGPGSPEWSPEDRTGSDGGMQSDQDGVGPQPEGVLHDVAAGRDVEHAFGVDGFLQGAVSSVLPSPFTPKRVHIDPRVGRRQAAGSRRSRAAGRLSGAASQRVSISPSAPERLQRSGRD